jgi:hypothetical protein
MRTRQPWRRPSRRWLAAVALVVITLGLLPPAATRASTAPSTDSGPIAAQVAQQQGGEQATLER